MTTIRKKLVTLFALVLSVALGALAFALIAGERARVTADITSNAIHFAEFSAEKIAELHDLYYQSQSYALFDSELKKILDRNPAIAKVELVTAEGKILFASDVDPKDKLPKLTDPALEDRLTVNRLSLATSDRVVYLSRLMHASGYKTEDDESRVVPKLADSEQVKTVIYPLADEKRRVIFHLSYSEVNKRILQSIFYLAGLFLFGFVGSMFVASWFARGLTAPMIALREGAQRIAQGKLDTKISVTSNDETKMLADTFNQMTTDLASAVDQKIDYERQTKEFEVASEIQTSILPKDISIVGLDMAVYFSPASEVGGDVYDVIKSDSDQTIFYLGDVTGHGVPAGIVAALTNAVIATASAVTSNLPEILLQTNRILHRKTKPAMFVTMLVCQWHHDEQILSYAVAGHEPALIYRAKDQTVEACRPGSVGLAMLPELLPRPVVHDVKLEEGDFLLGFTDGIVEARNEAGDMLGSKGLSRIMQETCAGAKTADVVEKAILKKFKEFHGECPLADDVTFFVVKTK